MSAKIDAKDARTQKHEKHENTKDTKDTKDTKARKVERHERMRGHGAMADVSGRLTAVVLVCACVGSPYGSASEPQMDRAQDVEMRGRVVSSNDEAVAAVVDVVTSTGQPMPGRSVQSNDAGVFLVRVPSSAAFSLVARKPGYSGGYLGQLNPWHRVWRHAWLPPPLLVRRC
jgi:hypothetical protein